MNRASALRRRYPCCPVRSSTWRETPLSESDSRTSTMQLASFASKQTKVHPSIRWHTPQNDILSGPNGRPAMQKLQGKTPRRIGRRAHLAKMTPRPPGYQSRDRVRKAGGAATSPPAGARVQALRMPLISRSGGITRRGRRSAVVSCRGVLANRVNFRSCIRITLTVRGLSINSRSGVCIAVARAASPRGVPIPTSPA